MLLVVRFMRRMRCQMVDRAYSVSELNEIIKSLLDREPLLRYVQVCGEISNFKIYPSGHAYFTLKDKNSVLKAVAFRSKMQFVKFKPENGMQVTALGSVGVYERDGIYQLYVERMLPAGEGALERMLAELKARLEREGLFDPKYKQSLKLLPKAVGIVTSPTGAAVRDIIKVAKARYPGVKLYLAPVRVQGIESEQEIVQALELLDKSMLTDVIIIGRGGGSKEDLWVFNAESIVRRIFACKVPVIAAVGHETDYTLVDYAADVRAATPSQAAELAVPDVKALLQRIKGLQSSATGQIRMELQQRKLRLERNSSDYLQGCIKRSLTRREDRLASLLVRLQATNPLHILAKGFATIAKSGQRITSVRELAPEDIINLQLTDGQIAAKVTEVDYGKA